MSDGPPDARQLDALKTATRSLRGGHEDLDPLRVVAWLFSSRETAVRELAQKLVDQLIPSDTAEVDVDDAEQHLRAFALARRHVNASRVGAAPPPEARENWSESLVRWWLTGTNERPATNNEQRVARAALAESIHRALASRALVSAAARSHREARVAAWRAERERIEDALYRDDPDASTHVQTLRDARGHFDAAVALLGHTQGATVSPDRVRLLRQLPVPRAAVLDDARACASWCAAAHVLAIVSATAHRDERSDAMLHGHLARMVAATEALRGHPTLPLLSAPWHRDFWHASASLLTACVRRGRVDDCVALLRSLAEAGTWTAHVTPHIARIVRALGRPEVPAHMRDELRDAFLHRLAFTSARRRSLGPSKLWRDTEAHAHDLGDGFVRWWRPSSDQTSLAPLASLLRVTRFLAAEEFPTTAEADAALRWWRDAARAWAYPLDSPMAPVAGVADSIARWCSGSVTDGPGHSYVLWIEHLRCARKRFVEMLLLRNTPGGTTVVANSNVWEERPPKNTQLDDLERATASMDRADTPQDRALSREALDRAFGRVVHQSFREGVGAVLRDRDRVEIATTLFDLPWEAMPVVNQEGTTRELGCVARVLRSAGPIDRYTPSQSGHLLVLCNPNFDGVAAEVAEVEALWRSSPHRGAVTRVTTLREWEDLPAGLEVRAVHLAGHLNAVDHGTPGFEFAAGGLLAFSTILEHLEAMKPRCVFLNACETLASSAVEIDGAPRPFGMRDVLRHRRFPAVIGTLWKVRPPDTSFVRAFYGALLDGAAPEAAMLTARVQVEGEKSWSTVAPAYVLLSRPVGTEDSSS